LDGLFASRIWPFIGRLTVGYRVQMNFEHPVSGFAKIVKKLFRIGRREESVSAYRRIGV
jgi:hypothetical protein